jgi:predicted nucleotidyltransferase
MNKDKDIKLMKEYLISKLREFARTVSERIDITKMIFFGSMATGEAHKDSDIDLIIVSQSFRRVSFWKRAIALYDYWDLDYPVDFLCFTPEEFEKKIRGVTIVSEAVKEGIEIT